MQSYTHKHIIICCETHKTTGTVSVTGNVVDYYAIVSPAYRSAQ